ncbi:hypothetical protein J8C06_12900 [Chloracidobacterium validum]|uniref:Uncharacterized protein n=1 Tax=Chloracidobacterium validum TaxID=2821543 RepID=A0ABX8BG78_9BACT|nr:hypothetical protein [Chloracidobacterium validum]QUW04664.1 hypothetical protein J8C06_12900 [Chloracidobacterium validum]
MTLTTLPPPSRQIETTGRPGLNREDTLTIALFTLLYAIPVAHSAVSRAFWPDELLRTTS